MLPPGARPVHAISRGLFQDLPLLAQDLVLAPQPLQLGRHILLPVLGRMINLMLAAAIDPVPQGRQADAEILGNLASRPAAGLDQTNGLILEFLRKTLLFGHGYPPASYSALQFLEASPPVLCTDILLVPRKGLQVHGEELGMLLAQQTSSGFVSGAC